METLMYRTYAEDSIVKHAAEVLKEGKLIIYPTDTVYGIGADATNPLAVKAVHELKQRLREQPISVLVSDLAMLKKWAVMSPKQEKYIKERLPGAWTFVLKPKKKLPVSAGSVGFRIPDHWCRGIAKALGKPVTSTSANMHGSPTPHSTFELKQLFGERIALYIDGGKLTGTPSQVVNMTVEPPQVIRE